MPVPEPLSVRCAPNSRPQDAHTRPRLPARREPRSGLNRARGAGAERWEPCPGSRPHRRRARLLRSAGQAEPRAHRQRRRAPTPGTFSLRYSRASNGITSEVASPRLARVTPSARRGCRDARRGRARGAPSGAYRSSSSRWASGSRLRR